MDNSPCQDLAVRFDAMAADGLLDVKFFVRNPDEATHEDLCEEVNRLYAAVEAGQERILDFNDSKR